MATTTTPSLILLLDLVDVARDSGHGEMLIIIQESVVDGGRIVAYVGLPAPVAYGVDEVWMVGVSMYHNNML
jgi:hypothetical protein